LLDSSFNSGTLQCTTLSELQPIQNETHHQETILRYTYIEEGSTELSLTSVPF